MPHKPKFYTFVLDTLVDWECGFILPILGESEKFELLTFGLTRDPVRTLGGFRITPDVALSEVADPAFVLIPGAPSWMKDLPEHEPVYGKLREWHARGIPMGGICGGTVALGRAGILNQVKHTGNSSDFFSKQIKGYSGHAKNLGTPVAVDQGIVTANEFAAVDFAFEITTLLNVFSPEVTENWLKAFKTGEV